MLALNKLKIKISEKIEDRRCRKEQLHILEQRSGFNFEEFTPLVVDKCTLLHLKTKKLVLLSYEFGTIY